MGAYKKAKAAREEDVTTTEDDESDIDSVLGGMAEASRTDSAEDDGEF